MYKTQKKVITSTWWSILQSDLMLLYQEVLADIRHTKSQQWIITTYVAGIYAGLITLTDKVLQNHSKELFQHFGRLFFTSLFVIVILVMILAVISFASIPLIFMKVGEGKENSLQIEILKNIIGINQMKELILLNSQLFFFFQYLVD